MSLINIISVPTTSGIKSIEIHHCDITKLYFNVDILVISAFANSYTPLPNTVIKSILDHTGIVVADLVNDPFLDLKNVLNTWISNPIKNQQFKYLLCIEGIKNKITSSGSSDDSINNLFATISLLPYKNIEAKSIALPILGTGHQKSSVETVLPNLIEKAIRALHYNSDLKTIYFVELNKTKAMLIDKQLNLYLERSHEELEFVFEDPVMAEIFTTVHIKLLQIQQTNKIYSDNETMNNLIQQLNDKKLRFFEFGILSRKLLELLLPAISNLKSDRYLSIYDYIKDLKSKNIAEWMITYLHTLRVFGNTMAHEVEAGQIPAHLEKTDFLVFAHSLNRFLDLYLLNIEK